MVYLRINSPQAKGCAGKEGDRAEHDGIWQPPHLPGGPGDAGGLKSVNHRFWTRPSGCRGLLFLEDPLRSMTAGEPGPGPCGCVVTYQNNRADSRAEADVPW